MDVSKGISQHHAGLLDIGTCSTIMAEIDSALKLKSHFQFEERKWNNIASEIFTPHFTHQLQELMRDKLVWKWPRLDRVDDTALDSYYSTTWHCDGGLKGMLKLLVYLDPVSEHGCNTLIYDSEITEKIKALGALPFEMEKRTTDLLPFLDKLGIKQPPLSFDLKSGDGLLFDPVNQCHRCLPPETGKVRYMLSFSLFPASCFN